MHCHNKPGKHNGYHTGQLYEDVDGRTRGVLKRVSYGIAYDSRLVFLTALSSQPARSLCIFLRYPRLLRHLHHNSQHKPCNRIACQQSGYTLRPQKKPHRHRYD